MLGTLSFTKTLHSDILVCITIQNPMDEEDTNDKSRFSPEEEEKLKKTFDDLEKLRERTMPDFVRGKPLYFKLNKDKKVIPCSMYEFGKQVEDPESRRIGRTQLGPYVISTVFLMIDHGFGGEKHLFFETMIWSEKDPDAKYKFIDKYQWRYETYEEAVEGHETIVTMVREGIIP